MVRITKLKMLLQPKEGAIIEVTGGTSLRKQWNHRAKVCSSDNEKVESMQDGEGY